MKNHNYDDNDNNVVSRIEVCAGHWVGHLELAPGELVVCDGLVTRKEDRERFGGKARQ